MDKLIETLNKLNPADLTYDEWLRVGMALFHEGYPVEVWDIWSSTDVARYHAGDCEKKWCTFGGHLRPVGGGSIVALAWEKVDKGTGSLATFRENAKEPVPLARPLDWEDEIEFDGRGAQNADKTNPQGGKIAAGSDTGDTKSGFTPLHLSPAEQLSTYLRTLFQPEDVIGYVTTDVFQNREGRWLPAKGVYTRRAGEILRELDRHPEDVGAAVGDWNKKCGAWIRLNPLDGHGVKNENVAAFRYVLVESDEMPIEEQKKKYLELGLPIATLVTSGGKSLHAAVHIDAPDYETYRRRVQQLYDYLYVNGVKVDKANRNPSRLSRMPGVTRSGAMQELIAVNLGLSSWEEWIASQAAQTAGETAAALTGGLPGLQDMAYYLQHVPDLPEELIYGVLRQGHKMLISGSSKAGKSFLLLELCIALSEGRAWLGFPCRKSKVLYINLEIDPASCVHRVIAIYQALGISPQHAEDFVIWNLRGKAQPLDRLAPLIIDRLKGGGFSAVVIDPIYKVITGDENNASDMAGFVNNFDRIAAETGCSVIYCHHHSKGAQGAKKAQDRASGSGVFARDPDAQLDIIQLELTDEMRNAYCDGGETAWRLEGSLREFANFKPVNFWFRYPVHEVDQSVLSNAGAEGSFDAVRSKNKKCTTEEERRESLLTAFEICSFEMPVTVKAMAEYLGVSERCVRDRIKENAGEFRVKGGVVSRNEA